MNGLIGAAALVLVVVQYGSFDPDPLNDLTINFNIKDSSREFADKEFEADNDETLPVVIGGVSSNDEPLNDLEIFDGEWKPFPPELPDNILRAAAVTFEERLYVVGGLNAPNDVDPVGQFTVRKQNGEWMELSGLRRKRSLHTATVILPENHSPQLVVTGGYGDKSQPSIAHTTEVYKLDSETNRWEISPSWNMKHPRIDHAAIVFKNKELYVIGGRAPSGTQAQGLKSVEVNQNREWTLLDKKFFLNQKRMAHGAVNMVDDRQGGLGHVLLVCGGKFGKKEEETYLRSCEVLDKNKWHLSKVGAMNHRRANFGLVSAGSKIWAFGGFQSKDEVLSSVEWCCEVSSGNWKLIWKLEDPKNYLKKARAYFGVSLFNPPQLARQLEIVNFVNSTFV